MNRASNTNRLKPSSFINERNTLCLQIEQRYTFEAAKAVTDMYLSDVKNLLPTADRTEEMAVTAEV